MKISKLLIEARDIQNLENLKRSHFYNRIEKYKKLFKYKKQESLRVNDLVLVQDHVHKYKGQPKFSKIGEISELLQNDCYVIKVGRNKFKRHISQLRGIHKEDLQL